MRSRLALLVGVISLTACTIVVQPAATGSTTSSTVTRPTPEPIVPLEITLARPVSGRLFVQTNRPAYVALFDIVPGEGVTLVQPASTVRRHVVYNGMTWVTAWWLTAPQRSTGLARGRPTPPAASEAHRTRYLYVVASDRPLSIPDGAFQPGGLRTLIGASAYEATSPGRTMRALRRFLPTVRDEMWAEDALYIAARAEPQTYADVRVYCGRGSVYQVPAEVADRVYCPVTTTGTTTAPPSPDSVLHDNGRRVQRRPNVAPGRGTIDRVAEIPADAGDNNPGNGVGRPTDRTNTGVGRTEEKPNSDNNGRRLGHTDSTKPGGGRADPPGRVELTGRQSTPAADSARPGNADHAKPENKPENKPETKNESKQEEKPEAKQEAKQEKTEAKEEKSEAKQEAKAEQKPEKEPEAKQEAKAEEKAEKAEAKAEDKGKSEDKAKSEDKGKPDDKAKGEKPKVDSTESRARRPRP